MERKIIASESVPKAVGPYSQAVQAGNVVYTSGVLPLDTVTGQVAGGDVKTQTEKVLENLESTLKAAGMGLEHVVKTTVFLTNLADFADMNDVYDKAFKASYPARTTVQVVALPRGVMVEIEAVAVK
ncbi:MAG: RidA family protein [Elusimicrobiales bacterium]|nr:RidA family protein [Elusimicrobiales bacterium]